MLSPLALTQAHLMVLSRQQADLFVNDITLLTRVGLVRKTDTLIFVFNTVTTRSVLLSVFMKQGLITTLVTTLVERSVLGVDRR